MDIKSEQSTLCTSCQTCGPGSRLGLATSIIHRFMPLCAGSSISDLTATISLSEMIPKQGLWSKILDSSWEPDLLVSSHKNTGRQQWGLAVICMGDKLLPQKLLSLLGLSLNRIAAGGNLSSDEKSFNQRVGFFNVTHRILCKQFLLLTRHITLLALISLRQAVK